MSQLQASELGRQRLKWWQREHIKSLFGDQTKIIEEYLEQDILQCIPVVLDRLGKTRDSVVYKMSAKQKHWKRTQVLNFHKSLDSRSLTFKSNEKKNMNAKSMIRELKLRYQE